MTRIAVWMAAMAMVTSLPGAAAAGTYRAGPLGAWDQNGDVSCEGGQMLLFSHGQFAVIPYDDDPTAAVIDTRSGRAKVGGNTLREIKDLRADPDRCAGPVDCEDWDGLDSAMQQCWHVHASGPAPANAPPVNAPPVNAPGPDAVH